MEKADKSIHVHNFRTRKREASITQPHRQMSGQPTDGWIDQPRDLAFDPSETISAFITKALLTDARTDKGTHPLVKMRGRIWKRNQNESVPIFGFNAEIIRRDERIRSGEERRDNR